MLGMATSSWPSQIAVVDLLSHGLDLGVKPVPHKTRMLHGFVTGGG